MHIPFKRRVDKAEFAINAVGVNSGSQRLFGVPAFIRGASVYSGSSVYSMSQRLFGVPAFIRSPSVYSGSQRLFGVPAFIRGPAFIRNSY